MSAVVGAMVPSSWMLMDIYECSWAYMSMVPWSLMCTNECALALEHSYSLMRTHIKQPWALMSIAQWPQKHSWVLRSIRDYSTMVPLKLIAPWHHSDQCLRVLRSAHGGSWMFMGALECSWVFLSDPECSSSWFSDKWKMLIPKMILFLYFGNILVKISPNKNKLDSFRWYISVVIFIVLVCCSYLEWNLALKLGPI